VCQKSADHRKKGCKGERTTGTARKDAIKFSPTAEEMLGFPEKGSLKKRERKEEEEL